MRCPKCGSISFDYLENCPKCGHDLGKISAGLGGFVKPDPELIWFSMDSKTDSVEEIDSSDLETVADDKVFQQALDNVLKNE